MIELQNSGYRKLQAEDVWSRRDFAGTSYSDGDDVEQRILSIVDQAKDLSILSNELRAYCTDWPSLYHLGAARANILRPFETQLAGADVLEIGAGCGAITRYLGEVGSRVVALEGSLRRATIARARCRGMSNVTVVADQFEAFDGPWKFDVVTLVGVFEYATMYGEGDDPAVAMLQRARQWLRPGGRLIIAIENKLGMKYFAGAPEDHGAGPMYGIEGCYRKGEPATYGRAELDHMLTKAGFAPALFWGAFPDYKLPKVLVSEDGFACDAFDAATLVSQGVANDVQMPPVPHFSLQRACPQLITNGLGLDLANSFLVVAQVGETMKAPALAYHFSASRRPAFCKLSAFVTEPDGDIMVVNHSLGETTVSDDEVDSDFIVHTMEPQSPYLHGQLLSDEFLRIVTRDHWSLDEVLAFIDAYLQALTELIRAEDGSTVPRDIKLGMDTELPDWCLDVIPQNIIRTRSGSFSIIDREWRYLKPVTVPLLLFRTLYGLSAAVSLIRRPADENLVTWGDLLRAILGHYGILHTRDALLELAEEEENLQQSVRGYTAAKMVHKWFDYPLLADTPLQHARAEAIMLHKSHLIQVNRLEADLQACRGDLERLQFKLLHVVGSLSWRVTAPLRHAVSFAGRVLRSKHFLARWVCRFANRALDASRSLMAIIRGKNGKSAKQAWLELIQPRRLQKSAYDRYIEVQCAQLESRRETYRLSIEQFANRPLISLVVPVYDPALDGLRRCVNSVTRQIYPNWELCLVDDCSTREEIRELLRDVAASDPRIRCSFRDRNGHIAAATNDGIAMASGDYLAFLDHDDELTEDALYHVAKCMDAYPDVDLIYTDQDKMRDDYRRYEPFFKPDWSPVFLCGAMYLGHLLVARTELVRAVGGCDPAFNGVQDYELALRLSERAARIEHIARVCYHWRASEGSIALQIDAKPGIGALQQQAVQAHIDRMGWPADAVRCNENHRVRIIPRLRASSPTISILICSKDAGDLVSRCLKSLYDITRYPRFEVLIADNGTTDPIALAAFARYPVRRFPMNEPFHFALFNNRLAQEANGDFLLFLNNDTEILEADWLSHLLLYAEQPDVAAVGPLLLYGDRTVQHAGVVLGPRGTADHVMRGFPQDCDGYHGSLVCDREVTAVTAACMMLQREIFQKAGGFNELYGHHYEDVDLCLRLRSEGYRNLYVAGTKLLHHESKSRGRYYSYTDRMLLQDQWHTWIGTGDPYYNGNLDPACVDYSISTEGLGS